MIFNTPPQVGGDVFIANLPRMDEFLTPVSDYMRISSSLSVVGTWCKDMSPS